MKNYNLFCNTKRFYEKISKKVPTKLIQRVEEDLILIFFSKAFTADIAGCEWSKKYCFQQLLVHYLAHNLFQYHRFDRSRNRPK